MYTWNLYGHRSTIWWGDDEFKFKVKVKYDEHYLDCWKERFVLIS